MRHATQRALAMLLTSSVNEDERLPVFITACGADCIPGYRFSSLDAESLLTGKPRSWSATILPDCPTCRVLIDAALEGRDLRAVLARATS